MDYIEKLLRMMKSYAMPASAQELEELLQKEALELFEMTLDILTNQDAHSEEDISTAILLNAMLMPRKFWLQAKDYHSERGLEKLKQMKQLLDAKKKAYGKPWEIHKGENYGEWMDCETDKEQ